MSKHFTKSFAPIPWNASPIDFAQAAADVPHMGIYTVETTQRFIPGTRHLTWDGRIYKYSLSTGTVGQGRLANHTGSVATYGVAYTTVATSKVVGDQQVRIASQSFAKDVLAGGMVLLYGADYTYYQQRGIMGNNYCSSAQLDIDLEAPLATAITAASTGIEVQPNPYRYVGPYNNESSHAGVPATRATSGYYFWLQTWGMCNVEPGESMTGAYNRQLVGGMGAGACYLHTTANAITYQSQHIGFILDAGTAVVPFVMLQISI